MSKHFIGPAVMFIICLSFMYLFTGNSFSESLSIAALSGGAAAAVVLVGMSMEKKKNRSSGVQVSDTTGVEKSTNVD